jgi:glycosyltransferase involved in cell wall biosynthesis
LGGTVRGRAKELVFKQADAFLHFSRYEGHPMAVLEALAYGVPCLLTPGTNMADVVADAGAGWEVPGSIAEIAAALVRVVDTNRQSLALASQRARRLALDQYSWHRVASGSVAQYRRFAA